MNMVWTFEQLLTSDTTTFARYQVLSAVDLHTLTAQGRAFHVSDVQQLAMDILGTHDVLVALSGNSLDSTRASAGDPAAAPEAAASPPPDLGPPSDEADSSRPRGSTRPPPVRHKANKSFVGNLSYFTSWSRIESYAILSFCSETQFPHEAHTGHTTTARGPIPENGTTP